MNSRQQGRLIDLNSFLASLIARAFLDMHFIVKKWIASNFTKKNTIIFGFHVRFESDLPSFLLPE
jgi:hypothetical protein